MKVKKKRREKELKSGKKKLDSKNTNESNE